jgi:AbrB family looped-hinge helix DNA binding protein
MKEPILEERLYDLVTVGERGQVVIPAQARRDFGIKPGDRLIVFRGLEDLGIVLMNSKHISHVLSNVSKSIGKLKKKIPK